MDLRTFDFNLLKVLHVLLTERSVSRAAQKLGRSQPAMSNALGRLRRSLGDDLLVRGQGGLVLTSRAEAIRGALNAAIASIENCVVEGSAFDPAKASGEIRACMPDRLSLAVLPPLQARLRNLAPGLALQVLSADRKRAFSLLSSGDVDLSLGWMDDKPQHVRVEHMMDEEFHCVFRPDHPIQKRRFNIQNILSYDHLAVSTMGDGLARFDDLLKEHGLNRRPLMVVTTFTPVAQILLNSDMIGIYATLVADSLRAVYGLKTRRVPIGGALSTVMAWPARLEQDKQHAWLRQQLRNVYADLTSDNKMPPRLRNYRPSFGGKSRISQSVVASK